MGRRSDRRDVALPMGPLTPRDPAASRSAPSTSRPPTVLLLAALQRHAVEAACCQPQSLLTARHALLGNRDAPSISARERFKGCQLGLQ